MSSLRSKKSAPRSGRRGPFGGRILCVGRLMGIDVGVDASWIIVFVLVTVSLAQQFGRDYPQWTSARLLVAGLAGSSLFFLSILLHELGHSFVSGSLGLRVRSITLFLFGGVAQLSGEPKRPRDAFLIALAGPMISLLLFLLFAILYCALDHDGPWFETGRIVAGTLALLNAMLVFFNSVPGLPLDGGHVLRSVVWAVTGSEERGTRVASATGVAFALVFIALGILVALQGSPFGGLWIAFVGWFMLRTARNITVQLFVRKHLKRIRLADAVREKSTASRWNSVADIQDLIGRVRRPVFIVDGEDLLGWVTPEQVRSIAPKKRAYTPVSAILVPVAKLIGLDSRRTLLDALSVMNENGLREVAVFEDDRPVGAMTRDELLRILRDGVERDGGSEAPVASS